MGKVKPAKLKKLEKYKRSEIIEAISCLYESDRIVEQMLDHLERETTRKALDASDKASIARVDAAIADELVAAGIIPYFNRNYVAPRLTELKDMGVVETCGRRKATRSPATEAVWRRKKEADNAR